MALKDRLSFGTFRGLGGDINVTYDIVPSLGDIEVELMEVAAALEDTLKPMLASRRIAQDDMEAHFKSETDPNGESWTELNAKYLTYKESLGYPSDILIRTDALHKAAISDEAFVVTPQGLYFNWDALPAAKSDGANYGQVNQAGSKPALATSLEELAAQTAAGETSFSVGRGKNLPARPFVGLSAEAEAAVWQVFDVWFDEAVSAVINPVTGIMQLHTPQFGKRLNVLGGG